MVAHERGDVTQRFLLNLVPFGTQIGDDRGDVNPVPGHYGIVDFGVCQRQSSCTPI
jgi:hypothetical protein